VKSNLSDIALVAEIVAAFGVILTLIFVGFQINDSSNETRAATIQSALDSELFVSAQIVEHADTWDKMYTGSPLASGVETRKAVNLFNLIMTVSESQFHQFQSGYLDEQSWNARQNVLRAMVMLPIFDIWRSQLAAEIHSADFLALLDALGNPVAVK
jgi:hypothetical protein